MIPMACECVEGPGAAVFGENRYLGLRAEVGDLLCIRAWILIEVVASCLLGVWIGVQDSPATCSMFV